jgi:hypothetical protein
VHVVREVLLVVAKRLDAREVLEAASAGIEERTIEPEIV